MTDVTRKAACVFGVDYACITPPEGGELYLTRHGWPLRDALLPSVWYPNQKLHPGAKRLQGATGTVYHIPGAPRCGRGVDLVMKISRFAQEVPIHSGSTFPEHVWQHLIAAARFSSPFEEFAALERLRASNRTHRPMLLTKRPLAIYCPPAQFDAWQLGRSEHEFAACRQRQHEDQLARGLPIVPLHADRDYLVLFGWVHGRDAEEMFHAGLLPESQMHALSEQIAEDLHCRGFQVLDNKPKHFILRPDRRHGGLLRRNGRLVYALIDFELLIEAGSDASPAGAAPAGRSAASSAVKPVASFPPRSPLPYTVGFDQEKAV